MTQTARRYQYGECLAFTMGKAHPVIVRISDGLMMPITGSPARRGEPYAPMPSNWLNDGRMQAAWAKPLEAGRFQYVDGRRGALRPLTRPDVVAAADRAFSFV